MASSSWPAVAPVTEPAPPLAGNNAYALFETGGDLLPHSLKFDSPLGPLDLELRVLFAGICGTDIHGTEFVCFSLNSGNAFIIPFSQ